MAIHNVFPVIFNIFHIRITQLFSLYMDHITWVLGKIAIDAFDSANMTFARSYTEAGHGHDCSANIKPSKVDNPLECTNH